MIRIRYTKSPRACFEYFETDRQLSPSERVGTWVGKACVDLGITAGSTIEGMHLALGLDGYDTKGRRFVRQMQPAGLRRAAYDMVVAPSKSVSLAALLGPPEMRALVRQAFNESSDLVLGLVESLSARQGKSSRRTHSGSLCAATYTHERSRYDDPHLHRHFLMLNVTRLKDGSLWALTLEFAMKVLGFIERIFQADLYRRLLKAGLAARYEKRVAELALPKELCSRFSRGHAGIVETMARIERAGERISLKRRRALGNIVNDRVRPRGHRKEDLERWHSRLDSPDLAALNSLYAGANAAHKDMAAREVASRVGESLGTSRASRPLEERWAAVTKVVEEDSTIDPRVAIAAAARFMAPPVQTKDGRLDAAVAADRWRQDTSGRARQALSRLARVGRAGART